MAKLTAPLFSFEARGAIAKSLVFFPWKGINAARKYVTPTNPNTTAQQTQRAWVTEAVSKIHTALADGTHPINSADKAAFSLWAAALGIVMTWFNTVTKYWVDSRVHALSAAIFSGGSVVATSTNLHIHLYVTASVGGDPVTGYLHYGLSKTSLINTLLCTVADLALGKDIPGLTNNTKYYIQYQPTTVGYTKSFSGIYTGIPKA